MTIDIRKEKEATTDLSSLALVYIEWNLNQFHSIEPSCKEANEVKLMQWLLFSISLSTNHFLVWQCEVKWEDRVRYNLTISLVPMFFNY